jgi:hypothetical protein
MRKTNENLFPAEMKKKRFSDCSVIPAVRALLLLFAPLSLALAQYHIDSWTTDNGLPQNAVRDIVQTRDGYFG